MKKELNGATSFHTGDINLAAAIMACGIPLSPDCPVSIIESESVGRVYGSFKLLGISNDGKLETEKLMRVWQGSSELDSNHPFNQISAFIREKPFEIRNTQDVFDFAIDYLRERGINPAVVRLDDIPAFVAKFPTMAESYILAFVHNRETCFRLYHHARREIHQTNGQGRDMRQSLIDTRLPRWQRNELLSRLQG